MYLALSFGVVLTFDIPLIVWYCLSALTVIVYAVTCHITTHAIAKKQYQLDVLEERINITTQSIFNTRQALEAMPTKNAQALTLYTLAQRFISLTTLESLYTAFTTACYELFPEADTILLFIFNRERGVLSLEQSIKKAKTSIREKQGGVIDAWVIKHNQAVCIEDIASDFRFDAVHVAAFHDRGIHSCMVSPLSVGDTLFGIIRIESCQKNFFQQGDSRLLYNIASLAAVTIERASLFELLEELAIKDALTGLYLRDYFMNRFREELHRVRAHERGIGLLMLDIDDFKRINDTYGHVVGDNVLKKTARIIKRHAGESGNIACRFGGEEFMALIVECDHNRLRVIADAIQHDIRKLSIAFRRTHVSCTLSGGAVHYLKNGTDALDMIDTADTLLYKAKSQGKNQICFQ